ncbi:MAG: hypothetical protein MRJ92_07070 [Nitrospira sp.]|nr:hypothetical protein [Nitrospira sp.]
MSPTIDLARRHRRAQATTAAHLEGHAAVSAPDWRFACGVFLAGLTAFPASVSAGSFRIYDHSASATGQASAFTAC